MGALHETTVHILTIIFCFVEETHSTTEYIVDMPLQFFSAEKLKVAAVIVVKELEKRPA